MTATTMADRLLAALEGSARRPYGVEPVDELAHALQCAELAAAAGADDELVLACLLHDVGRVAVDQRRVADTLTGARVTGRARGHHEAGAELVAPWAPARVVALIRMHADAKRYLCGTAPDYLETLSAGSRRTLGLQGGVMAPEEAARFRRAPWWEDAVRLRRWDDQAKVPGRSTRPLAAWEPLLRRYFDRPPLAAPAPSA